MVQAMYEIRVAGAVAEEDLKDMGAVRFSVEQVNTVLYGVADQSALYGLLARLRSLGLDVIEVRRVREPSVETIEPQPLQPDERGPDPTEE